MVDITGVNAAVTNQQAGVSASARGDLQALKSNSQVEEQPVKIPAVEESEIRPDTEDRRFSRVVETARRFASDFFAISDTRFTIFKDGSGQYITRFTNLRDGSVTFYPEPDMMALLGKRGFYTDALYKTNA